VFHWQNRFNPSPFAAYLAWNDRAVVSASPELFLKVDGDSILTKPIKGTRPRNPSLSDEAAENTEHFHDLVLSEKDQAELAMIVDLERNDLARVCQPGTRGVSCAREIEAFPTVYHAVAAVEGQLSSPPSPQRVIDILKATFPGGSITGAPKIRSMEIIDELEPTARSIYTGSIGWIGLNGDLCWNIAIRTIILSGQKATIQAGGGIVADSDPQAEWDETWTKARALLAGIDAVNTI
jgi:para-aminobenzoate synthetase component 1